MKKLNYFLFYVLFTSCSQDSINMKIQESEVKTIIVGSPIDQPPLSDVIAPITCINLETTDKSLISSVDKVLFIKDRYFILDTKFSAIKVFDQTGKYLYDLGRLGKGPGQFLRAVDMLYDHLTNNILILTNTPSKLLMFSPEGRFIREKTLNFFASKFEHYEDGFCFFNNQNPSGADQRKNFLFTDRNYSISSRLFDYPNGVTESYNYTGDIFLSDSLLYLVPPFTNTVYQGSANVLRPKYQFDFGPDAIPSDLSSLGSLKDISRNYSFIRANNFIDGDLMGFQNTNKKGLIFSLVNIRSGEIISNHLKTSPSNLFLQGPIFKLNDRFVTPIHYTSLKEAFLAHEGKFDPKFAQILNELKLSGEISNPSLMIFSINQF